MKYKGHNPRVDSNQKEIVQELRERGALVVILGQPVDLLIGWHGQWCLCEVKSSPKAKIQASQSAFLDQCRAHQVPCFLLDHLDDVDTFFPLENIGQRIDAEKIPDELSRN